MIIIGGQNGTGKTSLCKALESYGIKCHQVPPLCYDPSLTKLGFEIYALSKIVENLKGDAVDESPLTVALYVRAMPFIVKELEPHVDVYVEIVNGIEGYVKERKERGDVFVWLTAHPAVVWERLTKRTECAKRDMIKDPTHVGALHAEEEKLLKEWKKKGLVDLILDTSERRPEELAEEVIKLVENKNRK
ncbi:hypothetical protein IPA_03260 [Ignicoccus pacificus DSM 13166]|uniref:Uncharacterized protein n=1 Tax=Ignicoccus pacificus DSM 13166 TaxID=940294 RepID=A0A977PKR3_9CREN|nr:hypothetical protein IPA_03260 [Ignicoccus pacificus DSM 13166]